MGCLIQIIIVLVCVGGGFFLDTYLVQLLDYCLHFSS